MIHEFNVSPVFCFSETFSFFMNALFVCKINIFSVGSWYLFQELRIM